MQDVLNTLPKEFDVLSGDDKMTFPLMKIGGRGVISVASNIIPADVKQLTEYALNGDMEKAEELHNKLLPLFEGLFVETNPLPIKAALAMKGMIKESYRLPMCEMQTANREKLKKLLDSYKILEDLKAA